MTVQEIINEAQFLLNDVGGQIYTIPALLPAVSKAYVELQNKFLENKVKLTREISAVLPIPAGTTVLNGGSTPPIPTDLLRPIQISESDGSNFIAMEEKDWEPETPQDTLLRYWAWREGEIKFVGATSGRNIKIRYSKTLSPIVDENTTIAIDNSKTYLAARTAAIAAGVIGGNFDVAQALNGDAGVAEKTLFNTLIHEKQSTPVRRRMYHAFRR